MTTTPIITAIARLADLDFDTAACELEPILDAIIANADHITELDARAMIATAERIDETQSNFAAEIRDCIRDNTDHL